MSIVQSRARMRGRARSGARQRKGGGLGGIARAGARAFGGGRAGARIRGRGRARGITARELRGFRKVTNLLRRVGMVPKGLRGARRIKK